MVSVAIASALFVLQAKPVMTAPKVVSVSMFKNGYAFVTREVTLNDGTANVIEVPMTSLGSLWFWPDSGTIDTITSVDENQTSKIEVPFGSWDEVLAANIGKPFTIVLTHASSQDEKATFIETKYEGIVRMYKNNMIGIETSEGLEFLDRRYVKRVLAKDKNAIYSAQSEKVTPIRYYNMVTKGGAKKVMMLSLERGMAWAPGYAIDLSNEKKLNFTAKATLLNDLTDLSAARVRLITGFPSLQFQNVLDPLSARMSVDDWLAAISPGGFNGAFSSMQMGGGGRGGEVRAAKAAAPITNRELFGGSPFDLGGMAVQSSTGEQLDDLFLYDLDSVTLKRGARSYQYLYQFDADYRRIYTWPGIDGAPVQHVIKFKNPTNKPISTAAATIFKKGEITGQGMMTYTAGNTESELVIGRSLDFKTEVDTDVTDRQAGAIKDKKGNAIKDLVTYEVTLEISNPKNETAEFNIIRSIEGKLVASEPKAVPDVKASGVKGSNPITKLEWTVSVPSGESKTIKFSYKAYVPTGQ